MKKAKDCGLASLRSYDTGTLIQSDEHIDIRIVDIYTRRDS